MATVEEFARRIAAIGRSVPDRANDAKRLVAAAVDQAVVLATPVDTGRARANWLVGLGVRPGRTVEAVDRGGGPTVATGQATAGRARRGEDVHISNNLPYIQRLNEGSSAQAPSRFVQLAMGRAIRAVRPRIKLLGLDVKRARAGNSRTE